MRLFWLAFASALLAGGGSAAFAQTSAGPSVRDLVEFTKIVQPRHRTAEALRRQVSPDGTRAFIVVRRGNVSTDRNHYEIQLLTLKPEALTAARPPTPETVFAFDSDQDNYEEDQAVQQVRWLDDRSLSFLGRVQDGFNQAYRLDLQTGVLTRLTQEAAPVVSFEISKDGRRMVYAVQVPNPPMQNGARSIVIGNQSFWTVRWGQQRLQSQLRKYRFFVADLDTSAKPRPLGEPFFEANIAKPTANISPDGRWAVLPRFEPDRTEGWSRVYPLVQEFVTRFAQTISEDPLHYYSAALVRTSRRMTAWRLDDGKEQSILDAPDDALPGFIQYRTDRLWQGGGASVILTGTHLPLDPDGATSRASHVIEYWPDTGRWQVVARMSGRVMSAQATTNGFVVVDGDKRRRFQRVETAGWREVPDAMPLAEDAGSGWSLRIAQSLNEPPDVFAQGPKGQSIRMTHLNPQFRTATWGVMKPYAWRDAQGREWHGGYMRPDQGAPRGKLPLVIQTYTYEPETFYLDGPNFTSGFTSAYPGRALLREGIMVLAMNFRPEGAEALKADGQSKLSQFYDGVRAAVNTLVKDGLVDPDKVGIIGFSTTGEMTLNLLTFSDLKIRAATLADGDTNTLFNYSVAYGVEAWNQMERMNRGLPYGPSRAEWLRNDPSMNTDCIRAAVRIESYGVPVYGNYDTYALLRRQFKPVEMVLIPGGAHSLSMPSERMISLQGNLDWYSFWLAGGERTTPMLAGETSMSLKAQYASWRQMRAMKADHDAKPRCEREPSRG